MINLSVMQRGSLKERLEWAFNAYDLDREGAVSLQNVSDMVKVSFLQTLANLWWIFKTPIF